MKTLDKTLKSLSTHLKLRNRSISPDENLDDYDEELRTREEYE
jgi:hypothetical protein